METSAFIVLKWGLNGWEAPNSDQLFFTKIQPKRGFGISDVNKELKKMPFFDIVTTKEMGN